MKNLIAIALGISGASIRDAASKTTVGNWLKRLGVDKQSTAISATRVNSTRSGQKYTLSGQLYNGQRGIYIQNNKKYIK